MTDLQGGTARLLDRAGSRGRRVCRSLHRAARVGQRLDLGAFGVRSRADSDWRSGDSRQRNLCLRLWTSL
jgi:hypothetical protein